MIKEYKNRRILSILMIVVMMVCMLLPAGCQKQARTKLEEIQDRGILEVGTTGDYMPMSYLNPETGSYVGFDTELTEVVEAGYYVGQDGRLAAPLIYEPFTHGQIGVLMPKGSEDLLDYVNAFLAKEKTSGRIDELADEYFFKYIEDEELRPAA